MKRPERHSNPIVQFFFPKHFMEEFMYGRIKAEKRAVAKAVDSQRNIQLGMQRVRRHKKGVFFFNLFNRLPIVGYTIFEIIGKKEKKELEMKNVANMEKDRKGHRGFLYFGIVCVGISVIGIAVLAVIN